MSVATKPGRIRLADWQDYFPDGVSLAAYQRIGRLIRRFGTVVVITLTDATPEALWAAMDLLEYKRGRRRGYAERQFPQS